MRRILALVLLLLAAFAAPSRLSADDINWRKLPEFPIVGFNFLWCVDEDQVEDQAEMGLTLITLSSEKELNWCQKYGMKGICYDTSLNRYLSSEENCLPALQKSIKSLKDHPACYGLQLTDEPGKRVFPGYSRLYAAMKQETGGKPVYTNLFPNWSQPYQHGYENYLQYLEAFCQLYKKYPNPLLVFDNYRNLEQTLRPMERLAVFCTNLEDVRGITQKYETPFWATVSSIAHDYYPDPNEADLNFEVFSSLAYGARGIGYFTTVSHPASLFQGGPFNVLKDKTPMWLWLRDINYRVRMMAPVLNSLKSTGVYFAPTVKDSRIFSRFPMLHNLPGRLVKSAVDARNDASILVGEFKDNAGEDWVMLVNLNMKSAANVQVQLAVPGSLRVFNSYLGKMQGNYDPWLRPGQGKLYKVVR